MLVPADDWRALMRGLRGNPLSPAFSIIEQRTTVVERSLFTATPSRNKELLLMFGVIADALLDQGGTHELGHAICHDQDERSADNYGQGLREKKPWLAAKGLESELRGHHGSFES